MFSLKEWNFEEYKAAVKEIEDPVDRLDELTQREALLSSKRWKVTGLEYVQKKIY